MYSKIVEFRIKMKVDKESLNEVNNDVELLIRVIIGNKTWVYKYDVKTRA